MASHILLFPIFVFTAYAVGCCNTGYYLVRVLHGEDIRSLYSGSTGARNVGRVLGRGGFLVTFIGDAAKGAFMVWLAKAFHLNPAFVPWLIPLVVSGHIWPVQLGLSGGKGLATALGGMLALDVRFALIGAVAYFSSKAVSRN